MTGSIAVSQCGHTPNRPGHHGTVVARTVGTVAISCKSAMVTMMVPICCSSCVVAPRLRCRRLLSPQIPASVLTQQDRRLCSNLMHCLKISGYYSREPANGVCIYVADMYTVRSGLDCRLHYKPKVL